MKRTLFFLGLLLAVLLSHGAAMAQAPRIALLDSNNVLVKEALASSIDQNANLRPGYKWVPVVVVDPAFDGATQVKTGPVRTISATQVTDTYSVRAKTAAELVDDTASGRRVFEYSATVNLASVGTGATYQTVTVTGILATDKIVSAEFTADLAPNTIALTNARVVGTNQVRLGFMKPSTGNITPTAGQVLSVMVLR